MTKCEDLVRIVNDEFARCLDHAFEQRFETKLETSWNIFTFGMVSVRADGEDLTIDQSLFIENWSAGYSTAMTVAGAAQFALDRRRPRDSGRHAERENERSSVEAEGCQSGPKGIAQPSPTPSPPSPDRSKGA